MKNNIFPYSILVIAILFLGGCKPEKPKNCTNFPAGAYKGVFTDDGASEGTVVPLQVSILDENTLIINTTGDTLHGPFVKRDNCFIGGNIEGKSCVGEIYKDKEYFVVKGTYSYFKVGEAEYPVGQSNNPQYTKVNGTFELKSN